MKNLSLKARVVGTVMILIIATAIASNFFFQRFKQQVFNQILEKANLFTGFAEETVNNVASLETTSHDNGATSTESGSETLLFDAVHTASNAAIKSAERSEGVTFNVTSMSPMNSKHQPDADPLEGQFRTRLLHRLEGEANSNGKEEVWEVNEKTNRLHVMRPLRLQSKCLSCHEGDQNDRKGTKIDGAFEVVASLDQVDSLVSSFNKTSIALNTAIALLLIGVMLFIF